MSKFWSVLGALALLACISSPAPADELGQKIAAWCGEASPGDTMTLTASETTLYNQHVSEGYNFSEQTRFEFESGEGVCTTTYTSNFGENLLATDVSVLHQNGNVLMMGNRVPK